jgi:hypothetical protein
MSRERKCEKSNDNTELNGWVMVVMGDGGSGVCTALRGVKKNEHKQGKKLNERQQ